MGRLTIITMGIFILVMVLTYYVNKYSIALSKMTIDKTNGNDKSTDENT